MEAKNAQHNGEDQKPDDRLVILVQNEGLRWSSFTRRDLAASRTSQYGLIRNGRSSSLLEGIVKFLGSTPLQVLRLLAW